MEEKLCNKAKYNQLLEDVRILRSTVIEYAITIEQIISEILIDYIGNNLTKNILEKHLFSDALNFDQKITLFNALNKDLLPKVKSELKVGNKLLYIKKLRNFMAHCSIHAPNNFIDNYDGQLIEFGSFTQKEEHVIVKVYIGKIAEDEKLKTYNSELFYETCKSVIDHLLEIHKQIKN
jgi:hypothetical protein